MDASCVGDGKQAVMVDYRVDDLDALLVDLAAAGVGIDPSARTSATVASPGSRTAMGTGWSSVRSGATPS